MRKENLFQSFPACFLLILFCLVPVVTIADDPKPTPTPTLTPDPCNDCESGVTVVNSDSSCANCFRTDELDCLEDPDCNELDVDYTDDTVLCRGYNDDPKCPTAGNPRCPKEIVTVKTCSVSGCCASQVTVTVDKTDCTLVEVSGTYACLCEPDAAVETITYTPCVN